MVVLDKTQMYQSQDLTLKFVLMSFRYVRQLDVPLRHFERYHKQVVGSALVAVVDFELLVVVAALVVAVAVVVLVGPVVAVQQHLNLKVLYFSAGWLLAGSELSTDFDVLSFFFSFDDDWTNEEDGWLFLLALSFGFLSCIIHKKVPIGMAIINNSKITKTVRNNEFPRCCWRFAKREPPPF